MSDPDQQARSPADTAFLEAVELGIEERSPYPAGSLFVDAEAPSLGHAIARALDEHRAVVLCYPDGKRRIVQERASVAAS